jgi:predicted small lipoprotein YifL
MLVITQILVSRKSHARSRGVWLSALVLFAAAHLTACGQPGGLFLPTEPEAAKRATLPQTILPQIILPAPAKEQATPSGVPSTGTPALPATTQPTSPVNRTAPQ